MECACSRTRKFPLNILESNINPSISVQCHVLVVIDLTCTQTEYTCMNRRCIDSERVCDGRNDCLDGPPSTMEGGDGAALTITSPSDENLDLCGALWPSGAHRMLCSWPLILVFLKSQFCLVNSLLRFVAWVYFPHVPVTTTGHLSLKLLGVIHKLCNALHGRFSNFLTPVLKL